MFLPPTPAPVNGKYACPHLAADPNETFVSRQKSHLGRLVTVVVTVKDACSQVRWALGLRLRWASGGLAVLVFPPGLLI